MQANDEDHWSDLMRRSQAGESQAYEQLLTELSDAIAGYVRHRFGQISFADDCVQESLIAIHQARHTFIRGRAIRPWVFAIVRNRTIDMMRRQRTHAAVFSDKVDAEALASKAAIEPDSNSAEAGAVLQALKPQHRQALVLTKVMGYSIAEAADQLEISTSAMKVRVHRATRAAVRALEAERE